MKDLCVNYGYILNKVKCNMGPSKGEWQKFYLIILSQVPKMLMVGTGNFSSNTVIAIPKSQNSRDQKGHLAIA